MAKRLASRGVVAITVAALALGACSATEPSSSASPTAPSSPATTGIPAPVGLDEVVATMQTSVALSALGGYPVEGAWGDGPLSEYWFDQVVGAGFTAVRLPVRFSGYQDVAPPYTIDPTYLDRVEWAVDGLTARGLTVILTNAYSVVPDVTPTEEMLFTDPPSQHDRFLAIWEQVAPVFADRDGRVVFEILNEPHGALADVWNEYQGEALAIIRESNPTRPVVLSPTGWSEASDLDDLVLPDDPNIIVTIHHYHPMSFTYQGVDYVDPAFPAGTEWPGDNQTLAYPWWDGSWDTVRNWTPDGLDVTFESPWAAVAFGSEGGIAGAVSVSVTTDDDVELAVFCGTEGTEDARPSVVMARAGEATTVDVAECSGGTLAPDENLSTVWIQNTGGSPPTFTIADVSVTTLAGDIALIVDPVTQVEQPLLMAAAFGRIHDVPIFLGEFGTFADAPLDSRVRWTAAVRRCAQENGIATSLWNFNEDFAVFDWTAGRPFTDLLAAATAGS